MAAKKPRIQPAATAVRFAVSPPTESWKSLASPPSAGAEPRRVHSASAAARQKSGMPITKGKSAAFHGQAVAAITPYPDTIMIRTESASDAFLGTRRRLSPRLEERIDDDGDRDGNQDEHHRPGE